jgi:subfamily B ATP-binding cassette protein MsbA
MSDYLKLLRFIKPYKGRFVIAIVCMIFSTIFDGISLAMIVPLSDKVLSNKKIIISTPLPPFLQAFVDSINNTAPIVLLYYMAVSVVILFLLKGIVTFFRGYLMSDIGQRIVRDIRSKLYAKLQFLSMDFFTRKRGGELISRITNDVKLVEDAVSSGSTDLLYEGLQVVLFTFVVFFINAKLALVTLVLFPVISLPIIKVGKALRKLSRQSQEKMADINSILYETIIGARIVRAFNMENHEIGKFGEYNRAYYKITMKSKKRSLILSPATEFLGCLAGMFVFIWGGREVIAGEISFGVFGLFLGSLLSMISPFKRLSQVNALNQQAIAASIRIHEVLESAPTVQEKPGARELTGFKEAIVFQDVYFNYATQEILHGIELKVRPGETIAIVGPSGTGKTTLVDLIPRFYDPQKGRILIDGIDIRQVTLESLRRQVGIVTQDTILFNDTIKANIAYGNPKAQKDRIIQAALLANAHSFIERLPLGYDTVIGDRGMKLSGGERQRIAIARALLKDPPILILDEATSQLDTESERIVQEALERLMQGRTVFVIAHRLSTVKNAQNIIVLERGRIVEQGSHSELLIKGGLYKKLCLLQA